MIARHGIAGWRSRNPSDNARDASPMIWSRWTHQIWASSLASNALRSVGRWRAMSAMASRMSWSRARSERTRDVSEGNELAQHLGAYAWPQPAFGHDVNASPEEVLKIRLQGPKIEQTAVGGHPD